MYDVYIYIYIYMYIYTYTYINTHIYRDIYMDIDIVEGVVQEVTGLDGQVHVVVRVHVCQCGSKCVRVCGRMCTP